MASNGIVLRTCHVLSICSMLKMKKLVLLLLTNSLPQLFVAVLLRVYPENCEQISTHSVYPASNACDDNIKTKSHTINYNNDGWLCATFANAVCPYNITVINGKRDNRNMKWLLGSTLMLGGNCDEILFINV